MEWLVWIAAILLLLVIVWLLTGWFGYRFACLRKAPHPYPDKTVVREQDWDRMLKYQERGAAFAEEHPFEDVWMRKDNLWLHSFWFDRGSDRTILLLHGYTGHAPERLGSVPLYWNMGFNVLVPDLRAHGQSEGHWIGMGSHDAYDTADWIRWLRTNVKPAQQVIAEGVSMGAATVLSLADMEDLPELKGIIADCGFTNTADEFDAVLKAHGVPKPIRFFIVSASGIFARKYTGYGLKEPSAEKSVPHARVPMLIVHGEEDDFVPTWMGRKLASLAPEETEALFIPGAGHAVAYFYDKEQYLAAIRRLMAKAFPEG